MTKQLDEETGTSEGGAADASWDAGRWEATARRRLTAGRAATPAQRLAWLEEALRIAFASGALARRQRTPPSRR